MFKNKEKGFTLIELLVVIAIIGILSSVVLASLNSARVKGRKAGTQSALRSLLPHLTICLNDGSTVFTGTVVAGTTQICSGTSPVFPVLQDGWSYITSTATSYGATDGTDTITCTEGGCVE